jgi:hypothetical protein
MSRYSGHDMVETPTAEPAEDWFSPVGARQVHDSSAKKRNGFPRNVRPVSPIASIREHGARDTSDLLPVARGCRQCDCAMSGDGTGLLNRHRDDSSFDPSQVVVPRGLSIRCPTHRRTHQLYRSDPRIRTANSTVSQTRLWLSQQLGAFLHRPTPPSDAIAFSDERVQFYFLR